MNFIVPLLRRAAQSMTAFALILMGGGMVRAATFTVTSTVDPGDGLCSAAGVGDGCTLREAIAAANATMDADVIEFAAGVTGTITLQSAAGPLVVRSRITINGPGARLLAVSGNVQHRLLTVDVSPFVFDDTKLRISGLTLKEGWVAGSAGASVSGGGVFVSANTTLEMYQCTMSNNRVIGGSGTGGGAAGGTGRGGAVSNAGNATLYRCTFTGNGAFGGNGAVNTAQFGFGGTGGAGLGSAVFNDATGELYLDTSTLASNVSGGGNGGNDLSFGGGNGGAGYGAVYNLGTMTVTSCTLAANTGQGGAGGLGNNFINNGAGGARAGGMVSGGGTSTVRSTVCAGNQGNSGVVSDIAGIFNSGGYNLIGSRDGGTGFTQTSDQSGTTAVPLAAGLGNLQDNGGPTNTMLPANASLLIDRGKSYGVPIGDCSNVFGIPCLPVVFFGDQRGLTRPVDVGNLTNPAGGDGADIGAVEVDLPQPGPDYLVTTLNDHNDGVASYQDCTLREALAFANATAGSSVITFRADLAGHMELLPALGTLEIQGPTSISATGVSIVGTGTFRLFKVTGGPSMLAGLVLYAGTGYAQLAGQPTLGGGIYNSSALTLVDCSVLSCTSIGSLATAPGATGLGGYGGGVGNAAGGTLTLRRCMFWGNQAFGGDGGNGETPPAQTNAGTGGAGRGGAVFNEAGATLTAENCTFASNSATGGRGGASTAPASLGGAGGAAGGGAIANQGSMTLTALTVTGNAVNPGPGGTSNTGDGPAGVAYGGGLQSLAGATSSLVRSTICAGNTATSGGADADGVFTSGGWNLLGSRTRTTGFNFTADQGGTDAAPLNALLGPLGLNGGPTETCALLTGSPALDRGKNFSLTTDQRGAPRTSDNTSLVNAIGGDGTDIGANEYLPPYTGEPKVVSIRLEGSTCHIVVRAPPGQYYRLQFSDDLVTPFAFLGSIYQSDFLNQIEFTDPGPLPARRFYRARTFP